MVVGNYIVGFLDQDAGKQRAIVESLGKKRVAEG
jgi:hypothetical protein